MSDQQLGIEGAAACENNGVPAEKDDGIGKPEPGVRADGFPRDPIAAVP